MKQPRFEKLRSWLPVLLLVLTAVLAVASFQGDNLTFDEFYHLTSGLSTLETGDYRLSPESPPLAKMWAALPLVLAGARWPGPSTPGWREGDIWPVGYSWFYDLNHGERLLPLARTAALLWLLGAVLLVYIAARTLFGPGPALLAMTLASLSPTLLAHGRLVTMDTPMAAASLATLLCFARLMERVSWGRLALAALSLSVLSLVKFSWPVVIPALVTMALVAILRGRPLEAPAWRGGALERRGRRLLAVILAGVVLALAVWVAVWTCYGWRYGAAAGPGRERALLPDKASVGRPAPETNDEVWDSVLRHVVSGEPREGIAVAWIRGARGLHLLPEAYLYGFAFVEKATEAHPSYLLGKTSMRGWHSYFPIAFALKTPLATMLLLLAGIAALAARRARARDGLLLAGLVSFAVIYFGSAMATHMNIGHRHLVPVYPVLFIVAGASVAWMRARVGRVLVIALLAWLALENAMTFPQYLSYFNEIAGGAKRGYFYLADSNIDWGQDLKRLARYVRAHGNERIKLAYFGSADPTRYGFEPEILMGQVQGRRAALTAGTYVVSVTTLLGVYEPLAQDAFWGREQSRAQYAGLSRAVSESGGALPPDQLELWDAMRRGRLLNALRHMRPPDERIGASLFVYHLSQDDVDLLTQPVFSAPRMRRP